MGVKIINKILSIQFWKYVKMIIILDQIRYILEISGWFKIKKSIYHINRLENNKNDDINRCKIPLGKI